MYSNKIKVGIIAALFAMCLGACGNTEGANIQKAMEAIENRNYKDALTHLESAKEAKESERLIYRAMGIAHVGLTEYDTAIEELEQCLKLSNGFVEEMDYDVSFYLATAYFKNENPAKAEEVLDAVIGLRDKEPDAYYLRGSVRLAQNKYEEAKADFNRLLDLTNRDYSKYIEIYELFYEQGYKEIGREYLEEALSKGKDSMSDYELGRMYYYLEEYQEACNYLEEARDDKDPNTYMYLGKAYEASGDYTYAARVYNTYITKDENNALIYNQLALCELQRGNYEDALRALEKGIALKDDTVLQSLLFNQITAYENLGDFSKARVLMEEYLKNYPDDEKAKREYTFLKTR